MLPMRLLFCLFEFVSHILSGSIRLLSLGFTSRASHKPPISGQCTAGGGLLPTSSYVRGSTEAWNQCINACAKGRSWKQAGACRDSVSQQWETIREPRLFNCFLMNCNNPAFVARWRACVPANARCSVELGDQRSKITFGSNCFPVNISVQLASVMTETYPTGSHITKGSGYAT